MRRLISVAHKGLSIWLLLLYEGLTLPRYRYVALRARLTGLPTRFERDFQDALDLYKELFAYNVKSRKIFNLSIYEFVIPFYKGVS
jgi:hypothetical protein